MEKSLYMIINKIPLEAKNKVGLNTKLQTFNTILLDKSDKKT